MSQSGVRLSVYFARTQAQPWDWCMPGSGYIYSFLSLSCPYHILEALLLCMQRHRRTGEQ